MMNKGEETRKCAWCGCSDQVLVQTQVGKQVFACEDWVACSNREQIVNAPTVVIEYPGDPRPTAPELRNWA